MRETSLSAKAALSCLLAVVRGYANTIMRYRARQVDIITRIVSPAHARECRRAAYYKDFPMGVIGAAAVAGEETSAAVFYKRGGTAVLLKRPAVAVITSGCLAACVSATSKKSLQVLPACDLLSCGTRARGDRHLQSLEAPLPLPLLPLLVPHSFISGPLSDKRSRPQMTPPPSFSHLSSRLPLKSRAHHTLRPPLCPLPQPSEAHSP